MSSHGRRASEPSPGLGSQEGPCKDRMTWCQAGLGLQGGQPLISCQDGAMGDPTFWRSPRAPSGITLSPVPHKGSPVSSGGLSSCHCRGNLLGLFPSLSHSPLPYWGYLASLPKKLPAFGSLSQCLLLRKPTLKTVQVGTIDLGDDLTVSAVINAPVHG